MTFTRKGRESVSSECLRFFFCRKFGALTSFNNNFSQNSHSKSNLGLPDFDLEALREVRVFVVTFPNITQIKTYEKH